MTADDGDPTNSIGFDEIEVSIANVKPSIMLSGDASADEGDVKTYSYVVTDLGVDIHTVTTSCGADGVKESDDFLNGTFQCRFPDGPATSNVTATVQDSDGAVDTDNQLVTVTVDNVAPVVTLTGDPSASEGDTLTYTYTVADVGDDPNPTITEDCGANGTPTDTIAVNSFDCTFSDGLASSIVSVGADDGDLTDNVGSDSITVAVANLAPVVTAPADQTADEGTATSVDLGTFTDPGDDDPWTVSVDWGDGSALQVFADSELTDGDVIDRSHTYADDGTYSVTVTVRETGGAGAPSGSASFDIVVANVAPAIAKPGNQTADRGHRPSLRPRQLHRSRR